MKTSYNLVDNGTAGSVTTTGGKTHVQLAGDLGGGSVALRIDLGSGFETDTTLAEVETKVLELPQGSRVDAVLTGSTSPDLNVVFHH
jgi:hypothetical protein